MSDPSDEHKARFDFWVCQGRMCTSNGADAVYVRACGAVDAHSGRDRCRVLRGGCYGMCDHGPNLVVRRHPEQVPLPDPATDRLSLTLAPNETVYVGLVPDEAEAIVASHLERDVCLLRATEAERLGDEASSDLAARIRKLRQRRVSAIAPKKTET